MYVAHDVNQGDRESRDGDCTKSRNGRREQREQRRVCGAGEKTTEVALAENFKDGASAKAPFACARPRHHRAREIRRPIISHLLTPDKNINTESYFRPVRTRRCNT
jgi:hypothetical protein